MYNSRKGTGKMKHILLASCCLILTGALTGCSNEDDSLNEQELAFVPLDDGTYAVSVGNATELEHIKVPKSYKKKAVTKIAVDGFSKCKKLISVDLPDSLITIGDNAFKECSSLNNVKFGKKVNEIGKWAFAYCSSLETINLADSVSKIDDAAFYNSGLKSITLPNNLNYVGREVFVASSLSSTEYEDEKKLSGSRYFNSKDNPFLYFCGAWSYSDSITYCEINDKCRVLGEKSLLLTNNRLKTIVIPKSVVFIGWNVTYNASGLFTPENIFYKGSQEDWNNDVKIGGNNTVFLSKPIFYYSETKPSSNGNYWHYNGKIPTKWN